MKGIALPWFAALPLRSIQSYDDLFDKFLLQFSASRSKKFIVADLHDVKHRSGEMLKAYLTRYNAGTTKVVDPDLKTFDRHLSKAFGQVHSMNPSLTPFDDL